MSNYVKKRKLLQRKKICYSEILSLYGKDIIENIINLLKVMRVSTIIGLCIQTLKRTFLEIKEL